MERIKRVARMIRQDQWPDSAAEERAYWLARTPAERVDFGRRLMVSAYRRVHGRPPARMKNSGRLFKPEP